MLTRSTSLDESGGGMLKVAILDDYAHVALDVRPTIRCGFCQT
jgi:hypothetical protein